MRGPLWISILMVGGAVAPIGCAEDIQVFGTSLAGARSAVIAVRGEDELTVVAGPVPFSAGLDPDLNGREAVAVLYDLSLDSLRLDEGTVPQDESGVSIDVLADRIGEPPRLMTFPLESDGTFVEQQILPDWAAAARVVQPDLSEACPSILMRGVVGPEGHSLRGWAQLADGSFAILTGDGSAAFLHHLAPSDGFPEPVLAGTIEGTYAAVSVFADTIALGGYEMDPTSGERVALIRLFDASRFTESSTLALVAREVVAPAREPNFFSAMVGVRSDDGSRANLRAFMGNGDVYVRNGPSMWNRVFEAEGPAPQGSCSAPTPGSRAFVVTWKNDSEALYGGLNYGANENDGSLIVRSNADFTGVDCLEPELQSAQAQNRLQMTGALTGRDGRARFLGKSGAERFMLRRTGQETIRWSVEYEFLQFLTIQSATPHDVQFGGAELPGFAWTSEDGGVGFDFLDGTKCPATFITKEDVHWLLPFGRGRFLVAPLFGRLTWMEIQ